MKEATALKGFGLTDILVKTRNPDGSAVTKDSVLGGADTYDFSNASVIGAVPITTKVDGGAAEDKTLDLSGAADQAAVTPTEFVAAVTVAAPTGVTASVDGTTGRSKLVFASGTYVQAYGEGFQLAGFGYGKGARIVYMDTQQSMTDTPTLKDTETLTITTANAEDTDVIIPGKRKGTTGVLTDTSEDYVLRSIIEGGVHDETAEKYDTPTGDNDMVFSLEVYTAKYASGSNKKVNVAGYTKKEIHSCSGTFGDRTHENNFVTWIYNFVATPPRDANGNITSDSTETKLAVSAYQALELEKLGTS